MFLILLLLAIFVWIGLTATKVDKWVTFRMSILIIAAITTDYVLLWR